jgi:phosphate:Na+ symporter
MLIIILSIGLMLFLGGLRVMSLGLEQLCGSSFSSALQHFTGNRISAFLLGFLFTALTQSSSLATVLVIGVVDAGIINLAAAIAVIIGANVGTTITGQLLSFHLYDYALYLVAAGGLLLLSQRKGERREAGRSLLGLGVLLYGLSVMGRSLAPVAETPLALRLLQAASAHPYIGILAGAAITAIVQSSSAVVGMSIAMAQEGALTLGAGAGILVGADVGTCVTSLMAGFGTGLTARRAAIAHLLFNLFSVALVIPVFHIFITIAVTSADTVPRQLANAHTLYNLSGAILLLLFLNPFKNLTEYLVRPEITAKKRILTRFGELLEKWF